MDDSFFAKLAKYISDLKSYLNDGIWDSSFLLKRKKREIEQTLRSLEAAKEDSETEISNIGREDVVAKKKMLKEIPTGNREVYILLNIMNGRDITAWEHALSALSSCSFGRPIYVKEEQARHAIASRGDSLNAGYVAIYVPQDAVINEEAESDALGQPIVGLKPEAVDSKHIIKFVHYNQEVYLFIDKKLIPSD